MSVDNFDDDYESECPKCGHSPIRHRECSSLHCNDGYEDLYDDDPINHPEPNEDLIECSECKGTGFESWCPECGADLSGYDLSEPDSNDDNY